MDLSLIINQFIGALWFLIPVALLVPLIRSPKFKGVLGEFTVNLNAEMRLDKDLHHLLKDVTLPTETGSTQIDHIIVSLFGVFVIETKNMKGWIFGDVNRKQWTQKIYKQSHRFQNPLHQNYKHVKTLERLFELEADKFHSVVTFVGASTFKTPMPENVTQGSAWIRYVKSKRVQILSPAEVESILEKVKSLRFARSLKTHRDHVRHVKGRVQEKRNAISCSKVGGTMVMRESKKGALGGLPDI